MFHMGSTDQQLGALMNGSTVIVVNGMQADPIIDAAEKYPIGWLVMMPGTIEPFIDQLRKR